MLTVLEQATQLHKESAMETIKLINFIIATVFFVCYSYQFAYILVPYLKKEKPHKPAELHRYAVLISARNEELVIGNLLDSISAQDYPSSLVRVFVVADNCTDKTAKVARAHGAIVYERFNDKLVGKGYALEYLLDRIGEEYGDVFDAYMVFDADNLLSEDYISRMNETFSDGYRIITSYRNSKNYGDNWISAGYALWFLREAKYLNNARYLLGTSCAVSGTGFMFSREILKSCGGWPFHLLVEDIEFTIHNVVSGEKVGYCQRLFCMTSSRRSFLSRGSSACAGRADIFRSCANTAAGCCTAYLQSAAFPALI